MPSQTLKGIVHLKMKILSLFMTEIIYVFPNPYEFLLSAEHKIRYFKERWSPNSSFFQTIGVNEDQQLFG